MSLSIPCPVSQEINSVKHFSTKVFNSISELDAYHWSKFVPENNHLMQPHYLLMLEETQRAQMRFKYVVIKQEEFTVGVAYFQVVKFEAEQLMNYFPEGDSLPLKALRKISQGILGRIKANLLVSGNTFMTGENGFYFKSEIDSETKGKLIRKSINEICASDSSISAVLLSDLYAPKTNFDHGFAYCGYSEIAVESDMSIQIRKEWKGFDDYLNALSSKYRVRTKKVYSLCAENHIETNDLSAAEIEQHEDRIFELYHRVIRKADFKLSSLTKDYFRKQKQLMPDSYKLLTYTRDNVIIGFVSCFIIGKRMEVHYVGMDHDVCKPIHLYQHMMYDMISLGINRSVEKLHFGRTAPEIKSTIGAVPSPMYGYLKHKNPLFNFLLVKPYTANLKPKEYTLRNPFK